MNNNQDRHVLDYYHNKSGVLSQERMKNLLSADRFDTE